MTRVKICGLRRPEDAVLAAEAGADFIGLIFYPPSHRYVTLDEARAIRAALDALPEPPALVGVFVNEAVATMCAVGEAVGLDYIQLSGNEPWELLAGLPLPAIKVVRPVGSELRSLAKRATEAPILLDAPIENGFGGTGSLSDWDLAARVARGRPILLSGGLTTENVGAAIRAVRPWGVDVSSGVETARVKDSEKIAAFIRAVRAADEAERASGAHAPLARSASSA